MSAVEKDRVEAASVMVATLSGLLICLKEMALRQGETALANGIYAAAEMAGYIERDLDEVSL